MPNLSRRLFALWGALWLLGLGAPSAPAQGFHLRFDRLAGAIANLSASDQKVVEQAIELIKNGENNLALVRLSGVKDKNSSVRILSAYAMLQLGNLLGAFDQARRAESAPDGNSYKCWFLAKVAFLNGDKATCRRELKHVKGTGEMKSEVRQLENELKRN